VSKFVVDNLYIAMSEKKINYHIVGFQLNRCFKADFGKKKELKIKP
jgi:hypothetical protein